MDEAESVLVQAFEQSILEYISQMRFFLFKHSTIIIMQLTFFKYKYEEIPNNPPPPYAPPDGLPPVTRDTPTAR
jgi:hypothetical protein